jgi:hypothetical protein
MGQRTVAMLRLRRVEIDGGHPGAGQSVG